MSRQPVPWGSLARGKRFPGRKVSPPPEPFPFNPRGIGLMLLAAGLLLIALAWLFRSQKTAKNLEPPPPAINPDLDELVLLKKEIDQGKQLRGQVKLLQADNQEKESRIVEADSRLRESLEKIRGKETQLRDLENRLQTVRAQFQTLKNQLDDKDHQLQDKEAQYRRLEEQLKLYDKEKQQRLKEIDSLKEQLARAQSPPAPRKSKIAVPFSQWPAYLREHRSLRNQARELSLVLGKVEIGGGEARSDAIQEALQLIAALNTRLDSFPITDLYRENAQSFVDGLQVKLLALKGSP